MELVASKTVALDALGWQKLDVTSVVQNWYNKISQHKIRHGHGATVAEESSKNKLTLLVDCSGCGYTIHPITFTRQITTTSAPAGGGPASSSSANETDADSSRSTSYLQNEVEQQPRHQLRNATTTHHHSHGHHHHHARATAAVTHSSAADAFESFPDEHLELSGGHSDDHLDNLSEIPFLVLETETVSPSIKRSRRRALECSPRVKQIGRAHV